MKKKNIINLIRYYVEKKDQSFRNEAYEIARSFDKMGDSQLAEYIMALLSGANTFEPQQSEEKNLEFLEKIILTRDSLHIPEVIVQDILGAVQAVKRRIGIHKFYLKVLLERVKQKLLNNLLAYLIEKYIWLILHL